MYKETDHCRICGNTNLVLLLDLGEQALTGVFPQTAEEKIESMPIQLMKCHGEDCCGLVQLKHSGSPEEMYGANYGYRSGLNQAMVKHLKEICTQALKLCEWKEGDLMLDIGSNDATLLKVYDHDMFTLVGMDPTGAKFKKYYPEHIALITDFFSAKNFQDAFGDRKAKIITSIAMFYDLESPQSFVDDIASVLADDGIWVLEQSYLPSMLRVNAYDTICHEHLEYYAMKQIQWMLEKADMFVLDASLNDANGGSFRIVVAKKTHPSYSGSSPKAEEFLQTETQEGINDLAIYETFKTRVLSHKKDLCDLLQKLKADGKTIFGLGASTKGNVILQFCDLTKEDIPYMAEVNEDKFGCFTPETSIPIISQEEADSKNPDYYLVMPWHFREGITKGMSNYIKNGGKLIFPLPELVVVDENSLKEKEATGVV